MGKRGSAKKGISSPYARLTPLREQQQQQPPPPGNGVATIAGVGSGAKGARGLRKMSPMSAPSPTTVGAEENSSNSGGGGMGGLTIELNASMESVMSGVFGQHLRDSVDNGSGNARPALGAPKQAEERKVNVVATPKREHSKVGAEIDRLIEEASRKAYPLKRLENLGCGSSSQVYKTIMLDTLEVCAEKVVVVNDSKKRIQVLRELEILRKAMRQETEKYQTLRKSVTESIRKSQELGRQEARKQEEEEMLRKAREAGAGLEESRAAVEKMIQERDSRRKKKKKTRRRKQREKEAERGDSDGSAGDDEGSDEEEEPDSDEEGQVYYPPDGSLHIVGLLGVIPNPYDGTLSICLEYQNAGSLQDVIKMGGAPSEKVMMGISVQLVAGLQFLHGMRVIHRDLKPSNCLVNSAGIVKLADFGLARTLDKGASYADSFMGTMEYMAPERVLGKPYTFASDMWSLGLTVHAVAVGKYPYDGIPAIDETLASLDVYDKRKAPSKERERSHDHGERKKKDYWALLHCVQELPVPLPPEDAYDPVFIDFIAKACAKEPQQRPSSGELLQHPFIAQAMAPGHEDGTAKTRRKYAPPRELLMSASEAAEVANAWSQFAANALARTSEHEELTNTHSSLLSDAEKALVRKLTRSDVFRCQHTTHTSLLDSLAHDPNQLSAAKIWHLATHLHCDEAILRTAFHAAVGDLRLAAMAAVVRSGNEVDLDQATLAVEPNAKALELKRLALVELSSDESSSSSEEEEEKKEEDKIDTDDENLMFSDEDCAPLTESEDDSTDSEEERHQADMLKLGRQMYEAAQMAAGAGVLPAGTMTLPPAAEAAPRR